MKIRRTDFPTLFLHWFLVATLCVSFATGMRIAADALSPNLAKSLSFIWLQGNVIDWHILSACAFAFVWFTYPAFLFISKQHRRFIVKDRQSNNKKARLRRINVNIHIIGFVLLSLMIICGALLYWDVLGQNNIYVRNLHRWVAWLFIPYVVLHVLAQFKFDGWRQLGKIFVPVNRYIPSALVAGVLGALLVFAITFLDVSNRNVLTLLVVEKAPHLDGIADEEIWTRAKGVTVSTQRGANFPNLHTAINVKALRVQDTSYWLFQWEDSSRSQKHLPLQKTQQGWKVLQRDYGSQDETSFYEDKFAVMFSKNGALAGAGTAHLGPQPLKNKPGALSERGLHYTSDGSIVDVWHWKSVRTSMLKQMDDNFFGSPKPAHKSDIRYTAGYQQDPKKSGGFKSNWKFYQEDFVIPKRLPRANHLPRLGDVDLNEYATDDGIWALSWNHTQPWSQERDTFKVGTVIPSILYLESFAGDRGDVSAVGRWENGVWTLEVSRVLDTGSPFDVAIEDGVFMWVAAFNRSQTRHSYHLKPIRLKM